VINESDEQHDHQSVAFRETMPEADVLFLLFRMLVTNLTECCRRFRNVGVGTATPLPWTLLDLVAFAEPSGWEARARVLAAIRAAAATKAQDRHDHITAKYLVFFSSALEACCLEGSAFTGAAFEVLAWIKRYVVRQLTTVF
jgi:hypothetical protein